MFKRGSRAPAAAPNNSLDVPSVASSDSAGLTGSNISDTSQWEDNAKICQICDAKLGKRYGKPRHHCRICGKCVCGTCTPNLVQIDGSSKAERACTQCIAILPKLPALTKSIADMNFRLNNLTGFAVDSISLSNSQDLEAVIGLVETKLAPLEQIINDAKVAGSAPAPAAADDEARQKLEATLKSTEMEVKDAVARAEKAEAELAEAKSAHEETKTESAAPSPAAGEDRDRQEFEVQAKAAEAEAKAATARAENAEAELAAAKKAHAEREAERESQLKGSTELISYASEQKRVADELSEASARAQRAEAALAEEQKVRQNLPDQASEAHAKIEVELLKAKARTEKLESQLREAGEVTEHQRQEFQKMVSGAGEAQRGIQEQMQTSRAAALNLGERMHAIAGVPAPPQPAGDSLLEAVGFCQAAVGPLDAVNKMLQEAKADARKDDGQLREEALAMKSSALRIGNRLHALEGAGCHTTAQPETAQDMIVFCEEALALVESRIRKMPEFQVQLAEAQEEAKSERSQREALSFKLSDEQLRSQASTERVARLQMSIDQMPREGGDAPTCANKCIVM